MGETYKLTYFNIRGVAEPIRFLFVYAGVDYEDNRVEMESWPSMKDGTPWGQLPFLEVGEKKLAQSNAIERYLAKKFDLVGDNDWEAAKMDELADALADLRTEYRKPALEQDETKKAELKKNFIDNILSKYLSRNEAQIIANGCKPYLVGKRLSWMDLQLGHFLEFFELLEGNNLLDDFENLRKLKKAVFDLPQIKAWVEKRPVTKF